jgi:hypothetical protein
LAGAVLSAGDAAAVVRHAPNFAHTRVAHTHRPNHVNTQQRFHNAGARQHANRLAATHQRFHKAAPATPTHTGFRTHFAHHPGPGTSPHVTLKLGPIKVAVVAPKAFPTIKLANKVAPIWKSGPKKIWVGGKWKVFVPFTAIGAVTVGGAYYWADAYVNVGQPYCTGVTADGCRLNWQLVKFDDGGGAYQCVQYCPRPNAPPPAQAVALATPPPAQQGGACEVTIHSEPNLAGQDATTGDEQPALSQTGWQNAIASIEVKSGVWDFFADENFSGNNMRLRPGSYQNLGPDWTRKINSMMCVMNVVPR